MKVFCEWWDLLVPISYKKMFYVMCEAFDKAWLFFALLFFKIKMRSNFVKNIRSRAFWQRNHHITIGCVNMHKYF